MKEFVERILEASGLTGEDLSECASVNLPDPVREHLDLTPAEVVRAIRDGEVATLRESKTVWQSGWETHAKLRRLLSAVRGVLNDEPQAPAAGRFYRDAARQVVQFGRIRHARLLCRSRPDNEDSPTDLAQRVSLRLRGKLRSRVPAVRDLEGLRETLSEFIHEHD